MKETKKQIVEQTRNELARKYKGQIDALKKEFQSKQELYRYIGKRCDELERENEELKEKVVQYEDWIRRLQEFMDMPEDSRNIAIKKYLEHKELKSTLETLRIANGLVSSLFGL